MSAEFDDESVDPNFAHHHTEERVVVTDDDYAEVSHQQQAPASRVTLADSDVFGECEEEMTTTARNPLVAPIAHTRRARSRVGSQADKPSVRFDSVVFLQTEGKALDQLLLNEDHAGSEEMIKKLLEQSSKKCTSVLELPSEVFLIVFLHLPVAGILHFRSANKKISLIFGGYVMSQLANVLQPPVGSWTLTDASARKRHQMLLLLYKRNMQTQRQLRKAVMERARVALQDPLAEPAPVPPPLPPAYAMETTTPVLPAATAAAENELHPLPTNDPVLPAIWAAPLEPLSAVDMAATSASSTHCIDRQYTVGVSLRPLRTSNDGTVEISAELVVADAAAEQANYKIQVARYHARVAEMPPLASVLVTPEPISGPTMPAVVHCWLDELALQRRVRQNIQRALFNYVTIEKQSHATPLMLPNGVICFSRWHLVLVFIKTVERDDDGRPIPNTTSWIKTGYLGSHTETVTSMKYDPYHHAIFTSSFDSTIRRWSIRDDSRVVGIGAKPSSQQGMLRCLVSYRVMVNGAPANNFNIFSFDLTHLKEYKWSTDDKKEATRKYTEQATAANGDSRYVPPPTLELLGDACSLICCGSEWGFVALMQVDRRGSVTLGISGTGESRVRQVRFINKRPFSDFIVPEPVPAPADGVAPTIIPNTSCSDAATPPFISPDSPPAGTVQAGVVFLVSSTFSGFTILSHKIYRRVDESSRVDNRSTVLRKGYVYFSTSLQMEQLQTIPEVPIYIDSPRMWWHRAAPQQPEIPEPFVTLNASRTANTAAVDSVSDEASEAHPYLSRSLVMLVFRRVRSSLMTLEKSTSRLHPPPAEGQFPYRLMPLPPQTSGATCGKISPASAIFIIGTEDGRVMVSIPVLHGPRVFRRHSAPAHSFFPSADSPLSPGSAATPTVLLDGFIFRGNRNDDMMYPPHADNLDFFGPGIFSDPVVRQFQARPHLSTDSFIHITMPSSFSRPVVNVEIDGWKVSAIDTHSTVLVFDLIKAVILINLVLEPSPHQMNLFSTKFIEHIIDIDCIARPNNPRHVLWCNSIMLVTPLPVTSHSIIADFSGLFHAADYTGAIEAAATTASSATALDVVEPPSAPPTVKEAGGERADSSTWLKLNFNIMKRNLTVEKEVMAFHLRRVQMQRLPYIFHMLYIFTPPLALIITASFIGLFAARLDGYIDTTFASIFVLHFLMLPHYFGINIYSYKPLVVHHARRPYIMRITADILYLIVFPIIYVIRRDTCWMNSVSWLILSSPFIIAILLAYTAARFEDSFEKRHRVALDPAAANKRYKESAFVQTLQTIGVIAFIVMFAMYFDNPKEISAYWATSLARKDLNIFIVFIPVWWFLAMYLAQVHTTVTFTESTRRCLGLFLYYMSLVGLHLAFVLLTFAPVVGFCFKFDAFYSCSSFVPHNVNVTVWGSSNFTRPPSRLTNLTVNITNSSSSAAEMLYANGTFSPGEIYSNETSRVVSMFVERIPCGSLQWPMLAFVSPLLMALFIVALFACSNVYVHIQHIRRGVA